MTGGMTALRIGTRGSQLALWQANEVKRLLALAGQDAEIVIVKTTGDKRPDVSLASIGGKGLFIKELEEALEREEIDIAVHSLKDVPSIIPEHFVLAACLERADPRDAWIHVDGKPIADMPEGAVIGTSAPRRRAQLAALYPHLRTEDIRGNVDSRIRKAREGQYAGQGIVAIECLASNERARTAARTINDEPSEVAATNERGVLQKFGTKLDCYSAVAVYCDFGVRWPQPPLSYAEAATDTTYKSGSCGYRTPNVAIQAFVAGVRASGTDVDSVYQQLIDQGAEKLL
jgi:hydroxymethylbilane synthase